MRGTIIFLKGFSPFSFMNVCISYAIWAAANVQLDQCFPVLLGKKSTQKLVSRLSGLSHLVLENLELRHVVCHPGGVLLGFDDEGEHHCPDRHNT